MKKNLLHKFLLGFGIGCGLGFVGAAVLIAVNPPVAGRAVQLLSFHSTRSAEIIHPAQP